MVKPRNLEGRTLLNYLRLLRPLRALRIVFSIVEGGDLLSWEGSHTHFPFGETFTDRTYVRALFFCRTFFSPYVLLIALIERIGCFAGLTLTSTFLYCNVPPAPLDAARSISPVDTRGWSALGAIRCVAIRVLSNLVCLLAGLALVEVG